MKINKKLSVYCLACTLASLFTLAPSLYPKADNAALEPKVVIVDAGGVFVQPRRWGIARKIGVWDLAVHKICGGDIKQVGFKFLEDSFGVAQPVNPDALTGAQLYVTGDGINLPQIWCDNMRGLLSGTEVIAQAQAKMDYYSFASGRERRLVKNFIKTIFDPAVLAEHMSPIPAAIDFITDCAAQPNITIMLLSNFASDAFDELYKNPEFQPIFKHIKPENLIVSGKIGLLKPEPAIYDYVHEKLVALDARFADPCFLARNCVFIDDQIENILGARQRKKGPITALHLASPDDYDKIRRELEMLDFL